VLPTQPASASSSSQQWFTGKSHRLGFTVHDDESKLLQELMDGAEDAELEDELMHYAMQASMEEDAESDTDEEVKEPEPVKDDMDKMD
jgi:hypothetical protein